MGGANSRASAEEMNSARSSAEQILISVVDNIVGMATEATAVSGSSKSVLAFALSSIKSLDEGVMKFVSQSHQNIIEDNSEILNAYYDATQRAQDAAVEVQRHAGFSITEIKRLQAVACTYNKGTTRARELALAELNRLDVEKMDLPQSLVPKLQEASNAYQNVIKLCEKPVDELKQRREEVEDWIWTAVGTCCLIVLSVATCAVAPPIGTAVALVGSAAGVSISTTAATTAAVAVGVGGVVVGGGAAAHLTKRIHDLNELANTIKEQQELLNKAKQDTEGILHAMKPLKDTVRKLQNKLKAIADVTSIATNLQGEYMEDITGVKFLVSLDTQLGELVSLSKTCDELCAMVDKAYQFFKGKSGFISERIRRGKNLF